MKHHWTLRRLRRLLGVVAQHLLLLEVVGQRLDVDRRPEMGRVDIFGHVINDGILAAARVEAVVPQHGMDEVADRTRAHVRARGVPAFLPRPLEALDQGQRSNHAWIRVVVARQRVVPRPGVPAPPK